MARWRLHLAAVVALLLVVAVSAIAGAPRPTQLKTEAAGATADAAVASDPSSPQATDAAATGPSAGPSSQAAGATATGAGATAGGPAAAAKVAANGPAAAAAPAPGTKYDIGASDSEIKVGGSTFTSGPAAVYGQQIAVGFAAGVDYVNSHGGIGGRKVTLKVYDDGADPAKQLANTKRLVEVDKVFALTMSYAPIVGDYVAKAGIPVFHLGQNQEEFTNPWWFPVGGPQRTSGYLLASFVAKRLQAKSVAIFYIDAAKTGVYSRSYAEAIAKDYESYGVSVPVIVPFAPDQTSCSDGISQASSAKVDFIDFEIDAGKVINCGVGAQVQGYKPPKSWGGYLIGVPVIHQSLGDFSLGMFAFDAFGSNYDNKDYVAEVKKVDSSTETYSSVTISYFISAILMRDSMSKLGTDFTRSHLRDVLNTFKGWTPGLTSDPKQPTWTWTPQCHVALHGGYVIQIQKQADGSLKWIPFTDPVTSIPVPPGETPPAEFSGCPDLFSKA